MVLTRSESNRLREAERAPSSGKRRKTDSAGCPSSIDRLPDTILGAIAEFVAKSSRALLACALSSPKTKVKGNWNNEQWEALDFADLDKDLAAKLTDADLANVLECIEAINKLKTLKLTGLVGIVGQGLRGLRGSVVLRQIDLSLVGKHESPVLESEPLIKLSVVIPVLKNIVDTFGNSLRHVQLPKKWREQESKGRAESSILNRFLVKYEKLLNDRCITCSKCSTDIWGVVNEQHWMPKNGDERGVQRASCYECTNHFCNQCEIINTPFVCGTCEKQFCESCVPTKKCADCQVAACVVCKTMKHCTQCNSDLCSECTPVETCRFCNRTQCMDCLPHNHCEKEGCSKSNCAECADADLDAVDYCESCDKEYCSTCRLREYQNKRDNSFCMGCRALLFPRLAIENESLRQRLDDLRNQEFAA